MSTTQPAAAGPSTPWYRTITAEQWRVLAAAKVGWMLVMQSGWAIGDVAAALLPVVLDRGVGLSFSRRREVNAGDRSPS